MTETAAASTRRSLLYTCDDGKVVALDACPFCDGVDLVIRKDFSEDEPDRWYARHVFCRDCHARGRNNFPIGWCETDEQAAEGWNFRGAPSQSARLALVGGGTR